jgi:hypothetical protein
MLSSNAIAFVAVSSRYVSESSDANVIGEPILMAGTIVLLSLIFIWFLVLASRFMSSSSNRICTSSPEFHSAPIPPL